MSQAQHLAANTATDNYRIPAITTDNGWTWTHRTITADITKDNPWTARFAASGQGIQIQHGPHAGRLVQQYTIRTADGAVQAVSVYSDDHGKTWRAGTPTGTGMDENKVVELSDGSLMLNSRGSDGSGFRKVAQSTDGGQIWSEPVPDKNCPTRWTTPRSSGPSRTPPQTPRAPRCCC